MIYLYDFLFIMAYLCIGLWVRMLQNCKLRYYFQTRGALNWMQFILIMLFLYTRPTHTVSESAVSFFACILTKLIFDIATAKMFLKNRRDIRIKLREKIECHKE